MAEYPFTDEGLAQSLTDLGLKKRQVYLNLRRRGHLGNPDSCVACPVAMYVAVVFGTEDVVVADRVTVTRDAFIDEGYGRYYSETQMISVPVPVVVGRFIKGFDRKDYPLLIKVHPKEPPL